MNWAVTRIGGRFHYGWLAAAVVFLILLAAAGTRATPSVLMVPLERARLEPRGDFAGDLGEYRAVRTDARSRPPRCSASGCVRPFSPRS